MATKTKNRRETKGEEEMSEWINIKDFVDNLEETKPKIEVIYVDHGIANRFENYIELNKLLLLPEYKELHDDILNHEMEHDNGKYSKKDFKIDFLRLRPFKLTKMYIKFILKNRSSWVHFSPLYLSKGKIHYSESRLISIIIMIVVAIAAFKLVV